MNMVGHVMKSWNPTCFITYQGMRGISDTLNFSNFHHLLQNHRAKIQPNLAQSHCYDEGDPYLLHHGRVILQWVSKTNSWKYTEHIKKKSFFSFQTDNHRITEVFFLFFFFFFFCCFSRERCDPWSLCLFTGNLHMNTLFSVLVENI